MCYWPLVNMGDSGCALASCWEWCWTYLYTFYIDCVVSENTHVSPMESAFLYLPLFGNSNWGSYITLKWLILHIPPHIHTDRQTPTPRKFYSLMWEEYACFLELHIVSITGKNFAHVKKCVKKLKISSTLIKLTLYTCTSLFRKLPRMPRKMLIIRRNCI